MGTRSLTHIKEGNDILCTIYRQMDGYPKGHGIDVAFYLAQGHLVNGIGLGDATVWNGMGCLAASLIKYLKEGPGGIYIEKPGDKGLGEEYTYTISGPDHVKVRGVDGEITIAIQDYDGKIIFQGTPNELLNKYSDANI